MNLKTNLLALLLLIIGTVALNAQTTVYTSTSSPAQYYRIPAIVTANNGDLLFFNDDRHTNNTDVGSNNSGIDLLMKRLPFSNSAYASPSTIANTTTYTNITPSNVAPELCYGDPAVVADRESDEVLVLAIGGTNGWTSNTTSYSIRSHNNGQTWDAPVQMDFGSTNFPRPTDNNVNGFFFASGRILQSKVIKVASYYRIYVAFLYTTNGGTNDGNKYNQVYYSDDFGYTWSLLGGAAITSADEAKLEELPNGDVVISSRYEGGRRINKFTYSNRTTYTSGSWGAQGNYRFTGGCAINGDMLTLTAYRVSDNRQVTLLLQSTATGTKTSSSDGRYDTKIFYHEIDGNTTVNDLVAYNSWSARPNFILPNTSTFGGYSAMTLQADDMIGVYYEGNTTGSSNSYSNLYYQAYSLEYLTNDAYTLTNPNPPTDPDVEVPDGIVPIYRWQGTNSDRWSDPRNWTVINAVNNTPLARGMVPPTPDENSNVKIEAPGDGEYNPVLETQLTVKNLYVAPGAAIGNQHLLRVDEKVYTDVEIPTNQWVRMSMPLRDTYSGDMYTTEQGGVIPADFFAGATYNPTEGNTGHNRVFPYAIYQRVFSDAVNVMTDDQTGTELHQLNSSWSVPYNDLAAKYQVAEGFDLWAPSTNTIATFRFPSATDEYAYYYSNGNASTRKETVNHTASGTMAYGNSGNGVMDVTITRAKRAEDAGVPMYAVGNPSFSYLDIAEFIRVNAYGASHQEGDASVVGNITPYVYKYDEGENLNGGEASETIYYLDNDDKKLHKVTAAVSNTTMPDNSTLADADGVYVAPTRGFRVMAGQAEVSAIEPKLIGQYVNASVHQAAVPFYSGTTQSGTPSYNYVNYDAGTWVTRSTSAAGNGNATFNMAISVGSSPDKVLLENFAGLAVCEGIVDPISQTITIPGGSIVAFYNDGNWSGITALTNAKILGCIDKNLTYDYNTVNGHSIGYANNVSEDVDVVINYSIELNSTTNINEVHLDLQNAFAIYADMSSDYASLYSKQDRTSRGVVSSVGDNRYYNAFDCFTSMTASLELETSDNAYICPEMFGTYKYKISDASQATGMPGSPATDAEVQFQVLPIEGNYNVVRIHNLYPVPSNDTHGADIIGNVEKINDNQYRLSIPGAQSVYHGGDICSNMWVAYGWNGTSRTDLTWIFDKSATPNYFTLSGSTNLQISQLSSNPNISLSSPGFRGTTVSFTATTPGTTTTYEPHTAVVTQSRTSSGSWFTTYTYTNTFTFDDESISYTTTTSNQTSNSGVEFGTTALENLENWLNANGYSVGGTSTLDNWSNNLNTTKSVRTREIRWEGGTVTTGATSTTITGFPQTAPYTGSTSGGSTTSEFSVGTNYEAINLKFTPAMFNANPGNNQSASSAPRKTAAQGSTMASVKLVDGDRTANTLITRRENGHNGYNAFEDASLIDVNDNAKSIATLAGNQMVAVNTLGDTTAVQLVLNNANGNVALTFDNLAALGSNARLFDATTGSETPLDANHQELTVNMTVNDSPLRYSIVWDVVSGTEEVELPLTDGDLWFRAFSSAKGTVKVVSSENMASVRLYDSTGKLVGSKVNAQNETMFEYLLSGIYVVEVSNGSETQSMKVNVK